MATRLQRNKRRSDALSKERIVETAIGILDTNGENALTFRALAAQLGTGSGAIYWHVADKNVLLAACTDEVIKRDMAGTVGGKNPRESIRTIALAAFDAIDVHPWVCAQLSRMPLQPAVLRLFEDIGSQLVTLDVPRNDLFAAVSALVNYTLGVAGQNAANARLVPPGTDRAAFLGTVAAAWSQLDADVFPVVHTMADQLRDHDDREQFLAGIDLILAGIDGVSDRK